MQSNSTTLKIATDSALSDKRSAVEGGESPASSRFSWLKKVGRALDNQRLAACLISLVVHTLLLLILAMISYTPQYGQSDFSAAATVALLGPGQEEQIEVNILPTNESDPAPPEPTSEQKLSSQNLQAAKSNLAVNRLQTLDSEFANSDRASQRQSQLQSLNQQFSAAFSSTGIDGRNLGQRSEIALARGGTKESERAVEAALAWLANHQMPSGAWSLVHDQGECNGQCRHPGVPEAFTPAATGLSLLAFLGAGYTHRQGKYKEVVQHGLYYLRQVAADTPQGASLLMTSDRGMYNQGIASFALCEAYQMTQDPDLRDLCQRSVDFITTAQGYQGGWGYLPKQPGDLTITGWQMMALKSAYAAGLRVEPATLLRAKSFLETQLAKDGVRYFYRTAADQSATCTAIGILMRLFLGDSWTDPAILQGLKVLSNHRDYGNDIYFRYYATLVTFHVGGNTWEQWNSNCRDQLIAAQATQGHEAGSWHFDNHFGNVGGRLYTTAMAALILEVYYRYAPLYQQADKPFEL